MKTRDEIIQIATELSQKFAEHAAQHDAKSTFPYENYEAIRASGYPLLTVPAAYGGWGAGLLDAVMAQEILGMGDGSTALAIAMHVQTVGTAAFLSRDWEPEVFAMFCREAVERGVLVNSCATEPELGSPSRGGKPMTTAQRAYHDGEAGWRISGRKTFASMSPVLDYFIVPAALEGEDDQVARFLIPRQPGITIDETWDSMGMRSTGSHDVVLKDVFVPDRLILSQGASGKPDPNRAAPNPWFTLTVSAVYLGVAAAAQKVALQYAHERKPTALGRPIATLEGIQRRLGESEYALQVARSVLYRTAEQWDCFPEKREEMGETVVIAKLTVTNHAIQIVDAAMRVVGGASMTHTLPLERYYRDVRAGLYHPPSDDSAFPLLGRIALQRIAPLPK